MTKEKQEDFGFKKKKKKKTMRYIRLGFQNVFSNSSKCHLLGYIVLICVLQFGEFLASDWPILVKNLSCTKRAVVLDRIHVLQTLLYFINQV